MNISGFSLRGFDSVGAFSRVSGINVGLGLNGSVVSTTASTDLAPVTNTNRNRVLSGDGITIAAGETVTIDVIWNTGVTNSQHILDNFNFYGTTTVVP